MSTNCLCTSIVFSASRIGLQREEGHLFHSNGWKQHKGHEMECGMCSNPKQKTIVP